MNLSKDSLNDEIKRHFSIIKKCSVEVENYGPILLASPPDKRYPYFYPRDVACASQLLRRLSISDYDSADDAFYILKACANFLKDVQGEDGYWGQRYSLNKVNKSIYKQEDNIAHGISICCNYILASLERNEEIENLDDFIDTIAKSLEYALVNCYKKELHLFYSTTSIHECALEQGFTLWVNFSFLFAFSLAEEVVIKTNRQGIISPNSLKFKKHFRYSVRELFVWGGRYVRRFTNDGQVDIRPDITLLTPFYYGFDFTNSSELEKSVNFLEKQLWDPELGMIMRYLPFEGDFSTHTHAGNGPWIQYTSILAQYHYWNGNLDRGDELLQTIQKYSNENGELPEHLSTCKRFEDFMEKEWQKGIDFEKEFQKETLLDNIKFDIILEEANNMRRSYSETEQKCMIQSMTSDDVGYVLFCLPLMWSHCEYMRALLIRNKDWWKLDSQI